MAGTYLEHRLRPRPFVEREVGHKRLFMGFSSLFLVRPHFIAVIIGTRRRPERHEFSGKNGQKRYEFDDKEAVITDTVYPNLFVYLAM